MAYLPVALPRPGGAMETPLEHVSLWDGSAVATAVLAGMYVTF